MMHLSLFDARARSGPGSRSRKKTPSKTTIGRIRKAQRKLAELGEVDVLTAGDNNVCPVCEEISEDGPYDLDTAEGLIPAHPFCRCAFVPAGTLTDAGEGPGHPFRGNQYTGGEQDWNIKRYGKGQWYIRTKNDDTLLGSISRSTGHKFLASRSWHKPSEAQTFSSLEEAIHHITGEEGRKAIAERRAKLIDFDPDEPRDPRGRWTFAGGPGGESWQKEADDALKGWKAEHPNVQAKTVELNRDLDKIMAEAAKFEHFKDWYDEQRPLLQKYFGEDWQLFAKFLSAASIQGGGKVNVGRALDAYVHFKLGGSVEEGQYTGVMNLHREQFKKAVEGELSGPKIVPFEKALRGDLSQVVVDRWMKRLLFKYPVDKGGTPQVPATQVIIKAMADKMGWKPAQLQAALWAVAMTRGGEKPWSLKKILADNEARIRSLMHTVHAFSDAIMDSGVHVLLSKLADAYRDARLLVTFLEKLQEAGDQQFGDADWDESKHLREPKGSSEGGRFASAGSGSIGSGIEALVEPLHLDPAVTDVGGDEWNKQTAVRLEREYQNVKPELEKIAEAAVTTGVPIHPIWANKEPDEEEQEYIPQSWGDISGDKQDEIFEDWKDKTAEDFLHDEIQNWQEGGDAMDDTKSQLAYALENMKHSNQYAFDALNELREERREEREQEIPYTNEQLMDAMSFSYETGYQGEKDVEITWDEDKLGLPKGWISEEQQPTFPGIEPMHPSSKLTQEMRDAVEAKLVKAFNDEAENKVGDQEPPEYLSENVGEVQDMAWDSKSDKSKLKWAQENGHVETPEKESLADYPPGKLYRMPNKMDPLGERDKTEDYQLTKVLAEKMSIGRAADVMMQRGVFKDRNSALRAAHDFDGRIWKAWKGDSASAIGVALQAATADELGGRFRPPSMPMPKVPEIFINASGNYAIAGKTAELTGQDFKTKQEAEKHLEAWLEKNPLGPEKLRRDYIEMNRDYANQAFGSAGGWDGLKAYIRAKWETSQYLLDKADRPEVDLYRGIMLKDKGREEPTKLPVEGYGFPFHFTRLPDVVVHRNGAQSTTTDMNIANSWKGVGAATHGFDASKDRVVLRMKVPRTAVLSLPAYGQNVYGEHEVVLAGTAWKKWDAWLGHAPSGWS